jgi:hypothetical protein
MTLPLLQNPIFLTLARRPDNADFANSIWLEHKNFVAGLDMSLRRVVNEYVDEREGKQIRWHSNVLLPILLNEIFKIDDAETLRVVCLAYISFDHFTHLLDDIADERREDKCLLAHASHILINRGRSLYLGASSDAMRVSSLIDQYTSEAMAAERHLWNRSGNSAAYNAVDFEALSRRGSLVCLLVMIYCDYSAQWCRFEDLADMVKAAVVGMQLLDDVVDVEKDFNNGIYTAPIADVLRKFSESERTFLKWSDVAYALLNNGKLTETIKCAIGYLENARIACLYHGATLLASQLATTQAEAKDLVSSIHNIENEQVEQLRDVLATSTFALSH